ncbi:hypothetical protein [Methylovulum psychrotolerans]|uniref:Uncharacterized protein n=1 Tax=Methylovulum psychrotolerans TaxID=1704499 RepID=A0A2S5CR02_9GAMM|nr:hypothetical protein [Methylovulum psychrotolerans]POZ53177.1 hypothetical protein AADEFJLK_00193 [Methylovulum psychrotolerans]
MDKYRGRLNWNKELEDLREIRAKQEKQEKQEKQKQAEPKKQELAEYPNRNGASIP